MSNQTKPRWKDAPEGAKWLVRNADGSWAWGMREERPVPGKSGLAWKYPGPRKLLEWRRIPNPPRYDRSIMQCEPRPEDK